MDAQLDYEYRFLSRLTNVREVGPGKWEACCPAHDDQRTSLVCTVGESRKLLVHCHAKCPTPDVVRAAGATWSDLFPRRDGRDGRSASSPRTARAAAASPSDPTTTAGAAASSPAAHPNGSASRSSKPTIQATYDYHDEAGKLIFQVCRMVPKDFRQRRPNPGGGFIWNMQGVNKVPYRLPQLLQSDITLPVYIVEGEKDADRLTSGGFIATCNVGGAGKWLASYSKYFRARHVVLIEDNDQAGQRHVDAVGSALAGIARSVRVIRFRSARPHYDISDWIAEGNAPSALSALTAAAPVWTPSPSSPDSDSNAPQANEADDDPHRLARLYAESNATIGSSLTLRYWQEQFWRWDGTCYRHVPSYEIKAEVSQSVKSELDRINIKKLSGPRQSDERPEARKITRTLVNDVANALVGLTLLPGRIEQPAWLGGDHAGHDPHDCITMRNGILDLRALLAEEDDVLLPHSPEWFSSVCLPFDFNPDAECPQWLRFVEHNLEGDQDRMNVLQEWFGYCLTADTSLQKFLLLEGEGSNGKSVVCAALAALLGSANVCHVPLEMFGQRFALTQTLSKLANIASECGDLDKIAEGFLKSFTSGDRMTFDRKNQAPVDAIPTARLVLATNNRPRFSDRSDGLWRRMLLLPLRVKIEDDRKVHGMDKPWYWERSGELPGIFLWAVSGLIELRKYRRFTEPQLSKEAILDYRSENNSARMFLSEHLRPDPEGQGIVTAEVYKAYKSWCGMNGKRPFSSNEFGKEVTRVFPMAKSTKVPRTFMRDGVTLTKRPQGYLGIGLAPDTDLEIFDDGKF